MGRRYTRADAIADQMRAVEDAILVAGLRRWPYWRIGLLEDALRTLRDARRAAKKNGDRKKR